MSLRIAFVRILSAISLKATSEDNWLQTDGGRDNKVRLVK